MKITQTGFLPLAGGTMEGAIVLPNDVLINAQDTGGTSRAVAKINTSDVVVLGDTTLALRLVNDSRLKEHVGATDYDIRSARTHVVAVKTADTSRNTTVTLADDPDLVVALEATEDYVVRLDLGVGQNGSAGLKLALSLPSGATFAGFATLVASPGSEQTILIWPWDGSTLDEDIGAADSVLYAFGVISNGANAGNATLQWAQHTSIASNTVMKAGSLFEVVKA